MEAVVEQMSAAKELSEQGVKSAKAYLKHRGYQILDTNWTCSAGTVDLVVKQDDMLVFVEIVVSDSGFPKECNSEKKRERFENIAIAYIQTKDDICDVRVRFDVLAISVISNDKAMIRHHVNAFCVGD